MPPRKNSRLWTRLRVLCCSGLDLMPIVPEALEIVREIIPNAAAAVFLTSEKGVPHGFFHEDSPQEVRALFQNEPDLFDGPMEYNVFRLVGVPGAPKIGQLLAPPPEFFSSNTYQLLIRASGHHHILDSRLEIDGRRLGLLSLFREQGCGFTAGDADNLGRVTAYFEHALRLGALAASPSDSLLLEQEAVIASDAEGRILFLSEPASQLLQQLPLMGPQWPDRRRLPIFLLRLLDVLRDGERYPTRLPCDTVPILGGALQASAHWAAGPGGNCLESALAAAERGVAIVVLKRFTPVPLRIWKNLRAAALTPQQLEVAFWMGIGGRNAVRARLSISEAVLRDCVKAIYEVFGCNSQEELAACLRRPAPWVSAF